MKISERGKDLIKLFEGCRLTAYDDGVGVWTIGYGHTVGVKPGDEITQEQADEWFSEEAEQFSNKVQVLVMVEINQNQFDALVSLAYNIGVGALSRSTLLRKLNEGDYQGAAEQFDVWNRGGGKVMLGLVRRREQERKLFEEAI
jgi:lysozyme